MTPDLPAGARCAVHPLRRAVDACPVCARPRCAGDAAEAPGGGCSACGGRSSTAAPSGPDAREQLVRAALAAYAVALLGGVVAAEYVGAQLFAYLTPFVVGVLTAAAAAAASAAPRTGPVAARVRLVAVAYAVLGVALGFVLEGSQGALAGRSLLPYAAAVLGVVVWTLPPRTAPLGPVDPHEAQHAVVLLRAAGADDVDARACAGSGSGRTTASAGSPPKVA